jgi:hypothetical protein
VGQLCPTGKLYSNEICILFTTTFITTTNSDQITSIRMHIRNFILNPHYFIAITKAAAKENEKIHFSPPPAQPLGGEGAGSASSGTLKICF